MVKTHVIGLRGVEGRNAPDQIAISCAFHSFLVEVQTNVGYIYSTCNACATTTWRLGLRVPLVAGVRKLYIDLARAKSEALFSIYSFLKKI